MIQQFLKFSAVTLCVGIWVCLSPVAAMEEIEIEIKKSSPILTPYIKWEPSVYPTDKPEDLFWYSKEEAIEAIDEAKEYNVKKISKLTHERLSKTSQDGLEKYGSYVDGDGKIYDDFEKISQIEDFVVDQSKCLGCGDRGTVYLAQNIETGVFCAVKVLRTLAELEINNLRKVQRLIKMITVKNKNNTYFDVTTYIFQHLVDGTSLGRLKEVKFSRHQAALFSYNMLKEIIYLRTQKAFAGGDINGNIMMDFQGHIRNIDLMHPGFNESEIQNFNWDKELYFHKEGYPTCDSIIYYHLVNFWTNYSKKNKLKYGDLKKNNSYYDYLSVLLKCNPHENQDMKKKVTWKQLLTALQTSMKKNETWLKVN